MTTQPNVASVPAGDHHTGACWAHRVTEQAGHLTQRFLALRPELAREDGRWGVALALTWLVECARSGTPWEACRGGELFWDRLACLQLPAGHEAGVVVDAAAGFVGFLGSTSLLPSPAAGRLRREVRLEGLAYVAMTLGLLSPGEVRRRKQRFARGSSAQWW